MADFKPAAEFYERLLGRAPDFVAIEGRDVLWQVRDLAWICGARSGAGRLGADGLARRRPRQDARAASGPGMEAGEPVPEGGGRKATVTDPEGNSMAFVQVP